MKTVELNYCNEGEVMALYGCVVQHSDAASTIELHLKTSGSFVESHSQQDGEPVVALGASDDAVDINERADRDELTIIGFPEYAGWSIASAELVKRLLTISLIRTQAESDATDAAAGSMA